MDKSERQGNSALIAVKAPLRLRRNIEAMAALRGVSTPTYLRSLLASGLAAELQSLATDVMKVGRDAA